MNRYLRQHRSRPARPHLAMLVLLLAASAAHAQQDSCLVPTRLIGSITTRASHQTATSTHSVLRPCAGRISTQRTAVLYSVGDGSHRELVVPAGELIEQRLAASLPPGSKLVDVWPPRTMLSALFGMLSGDRSTLTGVSGFDGDRKSLALTGSLLMIEATPLPLAVFGFDPNQPAKLVQDGRSVTLEASQGSLALRFDGLRAGLASLEQAGGRRATVRLVPPDEEPDLVAELDSIDRTESDPDSRQLRRALLLQDAEYPVNAVAETMKRARR